MDFDWRVDDTQMRALANQLMNEGEEQILRLFACWCARQLPIYSDTREEQINIAEKYALGLYPEVEFQAVKDKIAGEAAAAFAIGLRHSSTNAPVYLAIFSCFSPDARVAAYASATWQRVYEKMKDTLNGIDEEEINRADQILVERQIQKLKQMVQDKWDLTD